MVDKKKYKQSNELIQKEPKCLKTRDFIGRIQGPIVQSPISANPGVNSIGFIKS